MDMNTINAEIKNFCDEYNNMEQSYTTLKSDLNIAKTRIDSVIEELQNASKKIEIERQELNEDMERIFASADTVQEEALSALREKIPVLANSIDQHFKRVYTIHGYMLGDSGAIELCCDDLLDAADKFDITEELYKFEANVDRISEERQIIQLTNQNNGTL